MRSRIVFFVVLILPFSSFNLAIAADSGYMVRDSSLRLTPNNDARVMHTVKAGKSIKVLKRKGGWYQVELSKDKTGWVRMTSLRLGSSKKKKGDAGLFSAFKFFSKGKSDTVVASTGVRGLDADDFINAKPDHKAVERLNKYAVNNNIAKEFAHAGKLKPVSIKFSQVVGETK